MYASRISSHRASARSFHHQNCCRTCASHSATPPADPEVVVTRSAATEDGGGRRLRPVDREAATKAASSRSRSMSPLQRGIAAAASAVLRARVVKASRRLCTDCRARKGEDVANGRSGRTCGASRVHPTADSRTSPARQRANSAGGAGLMVVLRSPSPRPSAEALPRRPVTARGSRSRSAPTPSPSSPLSPSPPPPALALPPPSPPPSAAVAAVAVVPTVVSVRFSPDGTSAVRRPSTLATAGVGRIVVDEAACPRPATESSSGPHSSHS